MPRAKKPQAPGVRSDGEMTAGMQMPGGQPNGRPPRGVVNVKGAGAGAGMPMPYGMASQLQSAAAQTPAPPGVPADAHAIRQSVTSHLAANPVTPLFSPTQNALEPVTAGAPMDAGPTNPMALAPSGTTPSLVTILQQAAQAYPSPTLRALAQRASDALSQQGAPGPVL